MKNYLAFLLILSYCCSTQSLCLAFQDSTVFSETFKKNGVELKIKAPAEIDAGSEIELLVSLSVPKGFHLYGSSDKTYPTKFTLSESPMVKVGETTVPAGTRHKKGGTTNYWLERRQTIKQALTIAENADGAVELSGFLDFMICDAKACKPPAELEFKIALNVKGKPASEDDDNAVQVTFEKPVRLKADGKQVSVESPGYASPCVADIDGDGIKDLLVGQFNDGKIKVYSGLGENKFGKGKWLKAGGKIAKVPGVW